jgi:hypothetical protein
MITTAAPTKLNFKKGSGLGDSLLVGARGGTTPAETTETGSIGGAGGTGLISLATGTSATGTSTTGISLALAGGTWTTLLLISEEVGDWGMGV